MASVDKVSLQALMALWVLRKRGNLWPFKNLLIRLLR